MFRRPITPFLGMAAASGRKQDSPMPHFLIRLSRNGGQTMTEYAVILGVITPLIIVALAALSGSIETVVASVTSKF
jgi:Flp pilus assembly pilin Flp